MKKLGLFTLPLLLAACGTTGTPGAFLVNVTADKLSTDLGKSGTASTSFTFTNKAGSHEVTIDRAMLTWADPATKTPQTVEVAIPAVNLPAGLTCAAAAASAAAACDFNDPGTTYADRSVTRTIADSQLFEKVQAANPSVSSLLVNVKFTNAANTLSFSLTTAVSGTPTEGGGVVAKAPAPVLSINTLSSGGSQYSGNLSVTVAGNFDATSTVDRIILEVTDAGGRVDNTTYVSTAANATFSIDTSKYVDGNLTLKAIALTKDGLRGETTAQTIQVANISAPVLTILSPDANAALTGPTTVRVQLRQGNTPFTLNSLDGNGNDVRVDVRDIRGQIVKTLYGKATRVSDGVFEAFLPLDLIGPEFSSNSYALEATILAVLSDGSKRNIGAGLKVTTQVSDNKPPALSVLMPAYTVDPYTNTNVRGIFSRNSALMIQASDDSNLSSVRVDLVCDDATKLVGQVCPRAPYTYNIPVDLKGVVYRVFDLGAQVDGQPYVQNGNYTLRVTAYDGSLANIQEFPIRISRADVDSDIDNLASQSIVDSVVYDTRPGELNIVSARWVIPDPNLALTNPATPGKTLHDVRVATLAYDNTLDTLTPSRIRVDPILKAGATIQLTQGFAKEGSYRIDFIVEDLTTGVTRYYQGGVIVVKKNAQ